MVPFYNEEQNLARYPEELFPAIDELGIDWELILVDDGSTGMTIDLTGYSIVEAADLTAAQALADGHPFLSDSDGDFAIDIFELMPVPDM